MKKKILVLTLVGFVFGMTASAATTVSLSPVNVSVNEGQNFNLAVSVNPQGVKNYTVKLEIKYPADILEVKSFSFGSDWMELRQTGYNLMDNINGVLIKTAGYPGGLDANASFGTVVFNAKKSGDATIQVAGDSLALDANSQNVIAGLPIETSVAVALAPSTSVPSTSVPSEEQTVPKESAPQTETLPEGQVVTPEQGQQQQLPEVSIEGPNPLLAAISSFITLGTGSNALGIIVLFLICLIIYFAYSYFVKKKK